MPSSWEPGANKARCKHYPWHEPPDSRCECGYYAFYTEQAARRATLERSIIIGAVLCWGKIEMHRNRFRAEYAMPIVLSGRQEPLIREVARRYGCETRFDRKGLSKEARKHGIEIPEKLRPSKSRKRRLDEALYFVFAGANMWFAGNEIIEAVETGADWEYGLIVMFVLTTILCLFCALMSRRT